MTVVPLPASPCVRVRMIWNEGIKGEGGTRFYLSYSGSAPTGANCIALADAIESAYVTNLVPLTPQGIVLNEIDVLDIATDSGLSGQWTGSEAGALTTTSLPFQVACNVEYGIQRRYRGGKPRAFFPFGVASDLVDDATFESSFVTSVNTGVTAFFAAIAGESIGAMGTLAHVNLSYYKGFTNITNSSGRERAVPTYRATALVDPITGYFAKATLGSQKRRRTSVTP